MATSLSRAFTTRRAARQPSVDVPTPPMPKRSLTTKHSDTIRQQKISHPVELLSTTNMLSYSAPDIYPRSRSSSNSSVESMTTGSSVSDGAQSIVTTPSASPEMSSSESSPVAKMPDLNHLSCYFATASDEEVLVPQIPKRAPSHTKKSSEVMARQRSLSRIAAHNSSISSRKTSSSSNLYQPAMNPGKTVSPKSSISRSRSSINMFSPNPEAAVHPFGNELAQVSELAEEFSSSKQNLTILDAEEKELLALGLCKFRADDYMNEIQEFFITAFGDIPPPTPMWI